MPKYALEVLIKPGFVTIEVEGESLDDVWDRRYDLAAAAEPEEWEVEPTSVTELEGGDA